MRYFYVFCLLVASLTSFAQPNNPCEIYDLIVEPHDCTDNGVFHVDLDFEYGQVLSNTFEVVVNDSVYGTWSYAEFDTLGYLTLGPFPGDCNSEYEFNVWDSNNPNPNCGDYFLLEPICCFDSCQITNLLVEPHPCDTLGFFYVDVTFDYFNPSSGAFVIEVDGNVLIAMDYGQLDQQGYVTVGPFLGDGETNYTISVCDIENRFCCAREIIDPIYCGNECYIYNLETEALLCTSNETYSMWLNFDHANTDTLGFDVWSQGGDNYLGFFNYDDLPLTLLEVPYNGSPHDTIKICDNDNPDCCRYALFNTLICSDTLCYISDVIAEPTGCDDDGNFYVHLTFNHFGGSTGFIVEGNGVFYGTFPYGQLDSLGYIILGPFVGDGETVYEFVVTDHSNPDCTAYAILDAPDCNNQGCQIQGLWADLFCDSLGNWYGYVIGFEFDNPGNDFFDLWINDEHYGSYPLGSLPIWIADVAPRPNSLYDVIRVCVNDNPNCCEVIEVLRPDCGNNGECMITNLETEVECMDNGEFNVTFYFDYKNVPSDNFVISLNGSHFCKFPYEIIDSFGHVTISSFPGDGQTVYEFSVCDEIDSTCCANITVGPVDCGNNGNCDISDLWADGFCDTLGNWYGYVIGFEHNTPGNDFFDIWINGEYYGFYALDAIPVWIQDVQPRPNSLYDVIEVCINDNPDCCEIIEVMRPDCGNTGGCELDSIYAQGFCDTINNTYGYQLAVSHSLPGILTWDVWINGEYYGAHTPTSGIVVENVAPRPNSPYDLIRICLNDHPDCCIVDEVLRPDCGNNGECMITNLETEVECMDNGEFNVTFYFDYKNVPSDNFVISLNGSHFCKFPYEIIDSFGHVTISSFSGDGQTVYEFSVCDEIDSTCCANVTVGPVDCGNNGNCDISNLWADGFCDTLGNWYGYVIGFEHNTPGNDFFDIWINGEYYGFYALDSIPVWIQDAQPRPNSLYDVIEVCINDNPDCCEIIEVMRPDCGNTGGCELDSIYAQGFCDTINNTYGYQLAVSHSLPGILTWDVWINGEYYGAHTPTSGIVVENVAPRPNSPYDLIRICLNDDPDCCIVDEVLRPDCGNNGNCDISNLWADGFCDTLGNWYGYVIGFEHNTPGNDFFDIWINGEFYGFYALDAIPVWIQDVQPRPNSLYDVIEVCINDNPDCCEIIEVMRPDCGNTGGCELDSIYAQGFCDTINNTYGYQLAVSHSLPGILTWDVWINGEYYGAHTPTSGIVVENVAPRPNSPYDLIRICLNDHPDCCIEKEVLRPDCGNNGNCVVDQLWAEVVCDSTGNYYGYYIGFTYTNPGNDFFDLWINNENYGAYPLGSLPILIEEVEPRANSLYDVIRVCINDNPNCCDVIEVMIPDCPASGCISNIEYEVDCVDQDFYITIDFTPPQPGSGQFLTAGNGNFYGDYLYDDLPITIGPLPADDTTHYEFVFVDSVYYNCHGLLDLGKVTCLPPNNIPTPLRNEVFMNNISGGDMIKVTSSHLTIADWSLYNTAGLEINGGDSGTNTREIQLPLNDLNNGMYLIRLELENGEQVTKKFVRLVK